jgi:2-C-methyl-D-erythritol 4-phosphate cytidylyltransferase
MKSSQSVIIVAGGSGNRMNTEIPKQFLLLNNKPVLFYSLEAFYVYNPKIQIIVVLPESFVQLWNSLCKEFHFPIKHKIAIGGKTRFDSVKNGLQKVTNGGFVAIHDGARPLIDKNIINYLFEEVKKYGNAIPVIFINESVRKICDTENKIADRSKLRLVQTPQIFKTEDIHKAYQQEYQEYFTDDASVIETLGIKIHLSKGNSKNIKITQTDDLKIAQALL